MKPTTPWFAIVALLTTLTLEGCSAGDDPIAANPAATEVSRTPERAPELRTDAELLSEAAFFELGPCGYSMSLPEENQAWGRILGKADASQVLEGIFLKGTVSARILSLLGLKLKDPSAFERLLPSLQPDADSSFSSGGCVVYETNMADFLDATENGRPSETWQAMAENALAYYQRDLEEPFGWPEHDE